MSVRILKALWICCFMVVATPLGLLADAPEEESTAPLELPSPVWEALVRHRPTTTVVRVDLGQLFGLPELDVLSREREEMNLEQTPAVSLGQLFDAVLLLQPVADSLGACWSAGDNRFYAECRVSPSELIATFTSRGWELVDAGDGSFLRQSLTREDEKMIQEQVENALAYREEEQRRMAELKEKADGGDPEASRELAWMSALQDEEEDEEALEKKIRDSVLSEKWKLLPGEDGWLEIVPPLAHVRPFQIGPAPKDFERVKAVFPLEDLLDGRREDLCLVAVFFSPPAAGTEEREAKHPPNTREEEIQAEIEKIRTELTTLQGASGAGILDRVGDMLFSINEIDGGFAVDITASVPGPPDESLTTAVLQIGLNVLRMLIIQDSPRLAREFLDTTVSASAGQVQARVVLSHASLVDYLGAAGRKRRRMEELNLRLQELMKELAELRGAEPGP